MASRTTRGRGRSCACAHRRVGVQARSRSLSREGRDAPPRLSRKHLPHLARGPAVDPPAAQRPVVLVHDLKLDGQLVVGPAHKAVVALEPLHIQLGRARVALAAPLLAVAAPDAHPSDRRPVSLHAERARDAAVRAPNDEGLQHVLPPTLPGNLASSRVLSHHRGPQSPPTKSRLRAEGWTSRQTGTGSGAARGGGARLEGRPSRRHVRLGARRRWGEWESGSGAPWLEDLPTNPISP